MSPHVEAVFHRKDRIRNPVTGRSLADKYMQKSIDRRSSLTARIPEGGLIQKINSGLGTNNDIIRILLKAEHYDVSSHMLTFLRSNGQRTVVAFYPERSLGRDLL